MEPQFRTSFVPKNPIATPSDRPKHRAPLGLIFGLSLAVFLGAAALSVGVFLYQQYLEGSITRKSQELEQARASFEPALIQELTRLDERLSTAGTLLDRHVALTRLFAFLEESTLQSVQYRNFRFNVLPDGNVSISMDGRAASFSSVALQSDVFGESQFIRSPIFENLNVDERGDVVFNVTAFVDPRMLAYRGSPSATSPQLLPTASDVSAPTTGGGTAETESEAQSETGIETGTGESQGEQVEEEVVPIEGAE